MKEQYGTKNSWVTIYTLKEYGSDRCCHLLSKDEPLTNISTRMWELELHLQVLYFYVHARQELSLVTTIIVAMFFLNHMRFDAASIIVSSLLNLVFVQKHWNTSARNMQHPLECPSQSLYSNHASYEVLKQCFHSNCTIYALRSWPKCKMHATVG